VAAASHDSGLGRSFIYRHIDAGSLVTSKVNLPGCRRGRLLIQRESHDPLIEAGIGDHSIDKTRPRKI